ncbi:MAG: hypothetical protein WCL34_14650, partial [Methylococcaceae bacterium]
KKLSELLIFHYSIYIDDGVFLTIRHLWNWSVSCHLDVLWRRVGDSNSVVDFFFNCWLSFYQVAVWKITEYNHVDN